MRPFFQIIRRKAGSRRVTGRSDEDIEVGQEREMSSVYGAEHLLRMIGRVYHLFHFSVSECFFEIVNMPAMVASSTMDPESVAILKGYIQELMK